MIVDFLFHVSETYAQLCGIKLLGPWQVSQHIKKWGGQILVTPVKCFYVISFL